MSVLVVGESLMDIVVRGGHEPQTQVGGSPLNVAVGLARLGRATTFASQVADDVSGRSIRSHLEASGVVVRDLLPTPTRTPTASALISEDGSASYQFDLEWDPSRLPEVTGHEAVHVGSLATVMDPGALGVVELVAAAADQGVTVSFDPNVRLAVEADPEVWRHAFRAIAPHATILKMSDEDARVLFPGVDPDELVGQLATGNRIVALTRGGSGVRLGTARGQVHVAARRTKVVDTIGAGDSYMATMLDWCGRRGWPTGDRTDTAELTVLGELASSVAAVTCSRPGADPPWGSEIGLS